MKNAFILQKARKKNELKLENDFYKTVIVCFLILMLVWIWVVVDCFGAFAQTPLRPADLLEITELNENEAKSYFNDHFTIVHNQTQAKLQWSLGSLNAMAEQIVVERSDNGKAYEQLKTIEAPYVQEEGSWIDQQPLLGLSFYRLIVMCGSNVVFASDPAAMLNKYPDKNIVLK